MQDGAAPGRSGDHLSQTSSIHRRTEDPLPSPVQVVGALLRHRYLLLGVPIAAALLAVGVSLLLPRSFTVTSSFKPQEPETAAPVFAGLAAQLGLSSPLVPSGDSSPFYASVLTSTEILRRAVESEYAIPGSDGVRTGDLTLHFAVSGPTRERRLERATEKLDRALSVRTARETGIVDFSVRTRNPELSHRLVQRLLTLLNEFNLQTRQSQAGEERRFLESRVAEARVSLLQAEETLQEFLRANRRFEQSPELRFQHDRLGREIDLRQQLYTTLSQAFEEARVAEVRNLPVITILEEPRVPAEPDDRRLLLRGFLAALAGLLIAIAWILAKQAFLRASRDDPQGYSQVKGLWNRTLHDVRRARGKLPAPVGARTSRDDGGGE